MSKSLNEVHKAAKNLVKSMGLKGDLQPGDLTARKQSIEAQRTKLAPTKVKDVSFKGLL